MRTMKTLVVAVILGSTAFGVGCASRKQISYAQQDGQALRLELAMMLVDKKSYAGAAPILQRVIAEDPTNATARIAYATVLREQGLYHEAERAFLTVIGQQQPKRNPLAYDGIAILYDLQKRYDDAQKAHDIAVALAPNNALFWNNRGFSALAKQDVARAIESFEKSLAIDPTSVTTLNNLGFAYCRANRFDDGLRIFRKAVGDAGALRNVAMVQDEQGNAVLAAASREQAAKLDGGAP
jgi:tetratricopeptide (TPR) repeat protein